jgi:hypothetical protein
VHDLSGPEKADRISDLGIFDQAQNIVVRDPCFLLRSQILMQIGNRVTGGLKLRSRERVSACGLRIDTDRMINIIRCKTGLFDFLS